MVHLKSQHDDTRGEFPQHDDSSSSLDVCEMTPLSPHTGENGFDFSQPSEGKVDFGGEAGKRRKIAADESPTRRSKDGSWQWVSDTSEGNFFSYACSWHFQQHQGNISLKQYANAL
ncbi:hypothetical protein PoB_006828100 [Plakobranchus ocellatus]|uniref:Uncharacterized protein n=1 Tax=Plakobranchus ocellatus TaxID=259542 RepID=A0AAV4DCY1_9GAST|nr:hypothetical protein PoB_006828100 [Plakobranchus ocellatus]